MKRFVCLAYSVLILALLVLLGSCQPSPAEQWELDRQNDSPDVARLFFTFFLANQDVRVFELAHPDLYDEIENWMNANDPVCNMNKMPEYVSSPLRTIMYCRCDIVVEGMSIEIDETYAPFYVVSGLDSIRYRNCIE